MLVDWRVGAVPREPTKIRPAVVVEDHELFPDAYPNTLVVPLTHDASLAYPAFAEPIEPTPLGDADVVSWALAHHVTSVSLLRVQTTGSKITSQQLARLRSRIALALGL